MKNNYLEFSEASAEFIRKARSSTKATDAQTFYALGEKAALQALEIWRELASNSLLLWIEIEKRGSYRDYTDFCARNGLEVISESDFERVVNEILEDVADSGT